MSVPAGSRRPEPEATLPGAIPNPSLEIPASIGIPPLNVIGLVVTKVDLINALHVYIPQITDISRLDREHFLLRLVPLNTGEAGIGDLRD